MEEFDLPFAPGVPAEKAAPAVTLAPDEVAEQAARMAADVDRRLAREQPDPQLPPIRRAAPEARFAGSTPLPFYSPLQDPAGITGSRHREMRQFPRRPVECTACGYRKLETRLEDPATLGIRDQAAAEHPQHFGPGERKYGICTTCHDVNGTVHAGLYRRWVQDTPREDVQRTFRHDPRFPEMAARVAEIDAWRWANRNVPDLGADLPNVREIEALAMLEPAREAGQDESAAYGGRDDSEYDGLQLDERVPALSDFTGAVPAPDGYRVGTADPEFAAGAPYDPRSVGADETEAWMLNEWWDSARQARFQAAWLRTGEIEDPALRQERRAFLVQRWDPRTTLLDGEGTRVAVTNPFAPASRVVKSPYARSAAHTGADEGYDGEDRWKLAALARHEAAVDQFLEKVRGTLRARGLSDAKVAEATALPDLRPRLLPRRIGREITRLWGPVRDRLEPGPQFHLAPERLPREVVSGEWVPTIGDRIAAMQRTIRPTFLAPRADLDQAAADGAARRGGRDDVASIHLIESGAGALDPQRFREMADLAQQREAFQSLIRAADARREGVLKWAQAIHRADVEVRAATASFGAELTHIFRDPKAFQQAFRKLTRAEKRQALSMLREHPETFPRAFQSAFGRNFGDAGAYAAARTPADIERAAVLTAGAGERYLDAVAGREAVRKHAAQHLDLPPQTGLNEVKLACQDRLELAQQVKTTAIKERDTLNAPTPRQLDAAFGTLHPGERARILREVPDLPRLLPERPRERARSGPSL